MNLIFDYIKDENFKYKLVSYSKYFQKRLNLTLLDYQEYYLCDKGLQFVNYIYSQNNLYEETFDKNIYNKRLEKDLSNIKLDRKVFDKIVYNYYNEVKEGEKANEEEVMEVDIYSPFFDIISRSYKKDFNYFGIPISINVIKKFNLKNDYISAFEKMNNFNIKYNSIFVNFKNVEDLSFLNELKINFNNIKNLDLTTYDIWNEDENEDEDEDEDEDEYEDEDEDNKEKESKENNKKYNGLKKFFSFNNFEVNLVYLNLTLPKIGKFKLESNFFENINLQSLEYLGLARFEFKTKSEIKINNLKGLFLNHCDNIILIGDKCTKMLDLEIVKTTIFESKSVLKFPNLEKCKLQNMHNQILSSFIDFSSLKKVKTIQCEKYDFKFLDNDILETVELNSEVYQDNLINYIKNNSSNKMNEMEKKNKIVGIEKEIIEKLIQMKTIKKITLYLNEINSQQISQIEGVNSSVTELIVNWNPSHIHAKLDSLQKNFPNLSYFKLKLPYFEDIWGDFEEYPPYIEINPKDNCQITKFSLEIQRYNNLFRFDCAPFNKLEEISFSLITNIDSLSDALPIFDENCKIKFDSLTKFHFTAKNNKQEINFNFIKNIYNNIDCMPNLKDFYLSCAKNYEGNEDFYKKFIIKLLSIGLISIHFEISKGIFIDTYTEDELKDIYPKIEYNKYKEIYIQKFD